MAVTIVGSGSITGLSAGGLPTGSVTADSLATNSVDSAELVSGAVDSSHLASGVGGKVLQVIQTHTTATSSQSLTGGTRANISGLNATITPSATSSKILVTVAWNGEMSIVGNHETTFGIKRDSTDVGNPATDGSRPTGITVLSQGYHAGEASSTPDSTFYQYLDSPSTISPVTFHGTILCRTSRTLYTNRTTQNSDGVHDERTTSTITLWEIGV
jgi:hypothetical protein